MKLFRAALVAVATRGLPPTHHKGGGDRRCLLPGGCSSVRALFLHLPIADTLPRAILPSTLQAYRTVMLCTVFFNLFFGLSTSFPILLNLSEFRLVPYGTLLHCS